MSVEGFLRKIKSFFIKKVENFPKSGRKGAGGEGAYISTTMK